ncbi:MAG: uL15 family ribosomal protein, partial [Actinomycetota bacterium]|nr:uL15 family ribosomal protein [Actinomycetota bacterium]
LVHKRDKLIKILGNGEIDRAMTVSAHAFSESARTKIEGAGGTVVVLEEQPSRARPGRKGGEKR